MIGRTLAHYRIERKLGEGGMGTVYEARDLRLERPVALKCIRPELSDSRMRERLWREARAAASVSHPAICQIFEVREDEGELFLVMELLEGETLSARLEKGPLPVPEVVRLGSALLDALGALHARSYVHRDLKPSNVFLLADGRVKLLDFGLVAAALAAGDISVSEPGSPGALQLTRTGAVVGTPQYMAPEQIRGRDLDGRADLFALAVVLYEAASGQAAFEGESSVDVMYSVLHAPARALSGSPAHEALGRVLAHALEKDRERRPATAEAMAAELGALLSTPGNGTKSGASRLRGDGNGGRDLVRIAVLPFRMLRQDPDLDFLGPGLADALTVSLAGIRSLIVRSTVSSGRFAQSALDLEEVARALDVDAVLVGTILPAGERCRVATQLVETPAGRVLWSQTEDITGRDAFQLQDTLTRRIVDSLQIPLSSGERNALDRNVPRNATAHEFFLRANQLAMIDRDLYQARELYLSCLDADPTFAPAWARLGHCHRILGKYKLEGRDENYLRAEQSLHRALALRPDLPLAHHALAQLDLDHGQVEAALDRLLGVIQRNPNDPEGYAGLVSAFRYAGLLEESLAMHERAVRLDPKIHTSVYLSYEGLGDIERAVASTHERADDLPWVLARAGRGEEALRLLRVWENRGGDDLMGQWVRLVRLAVETEFGPIGEVPVFDDDFPDPEGHTFVASLFVRVGKIERGLAALERGVSGGYANVRHIERDPWLAPIRTDPRYAAALESAREHHHVLAAAYGGRVPRDSAST